MNYFAHGLRFVDRPWYLAGTALPDWLSVADRQSRVRTNRVAPFVDDADPSVAELAAGILQHLHDDAWFHAAPIFYSVTGELTGLFRRALPEDDGHRPSILGHIVTELLLDAVLIEREPGRLEDYYRAVEQIDPALVQAAVNRMVQRPAERLSTFIPLFTRERFLADYLCSDRLRFRLNQVMRRVTLSPLPAEVEPVLSTARTIVETHADALLSGFESAPHVHLHKT